MVMLHKDLNAIDHNNYNRSFHLFKHHKRHYLCKNNTDLQDDTKLLA